MARHLGWRLLAGAVVVLSACSSPTGVINRLTIVNGTSYDLEIRAKDADRGGWILLGRTLRDQRTVEERMDDLGDVWIFRFDFAGTVFGGELRVDRADLERNGWRVDVPRDVERRLRARGIKPSPSEEGGPLPTP